MGTTLQANNGLLSIFGVIYFWQISKNWLWFEMFGCSVGLLSLAGMTFYLPESPKFLISKKRYDDARSAISYMAKVNRKAPFTHKFDREVIDAKCSTNYVSTFVTENT